MDNVKNDEYYLRKVLNDISFINDHMENVSMEEFENNDILIDSMMFRLIQISENAKMISDEFKNKYNQVPWTEIYGLRNRIVHDYGNVDLSIVYDTLKSDIPEVDRLLAIHSVLKDLSR